MQGVGDQIEHDALQALLEHIEHQPRDACARRFLERCKRPNKEPKLPARDQFVTDKLLGYGAFGKVEKVGYRGPNTALSGLFALKSLSKGEMLRRHVHYFVERDILIASRMQQNPWVCKVHSCFQDENCLYILMDLAENGDLSQLLAVLEEGMEIAAVRFYLAELVLAIESLHKNGFAHFDLKPENILLDSQMHLVLTDFGNAVQLNGKSSTKMTAAVGTPNYLSPEMLAAIQSESSVGYEADIWALGIIAYEMAFGFNPFCGDSVAETYDRIQNYTIEFPPDSDPDFCDLVKSLCCRNGSSRPPLREIKRHEFFRGIDWDILRSQVPPKVDLGEASCARSSARDEKIEMTLQAPRNMSRLDSASLTAFVGYSWVCPEFEANLSRSAASLDRAAAILTPPPNEPVEEVSILRKLLKEAQVSETLLRAENRAQDKRIRQLEAKVSNQQ